MIMKRKAESRKTTCTEQTGISISLYKVAYQLGMLKAHGTDTGYRSTQGVASKASSPSATSYPYQSNIRVHDSRSLVFLPLQSHHHALFPIPL